MSANRNGAGRLKAYPTSASDEMAAFDDLPAEIRRRLRDLPVSVASIPLLRFWQSERGTCLDRLDGLKVALARAFPDHEGLPG